MMMDGEEDLNKWQFVEVAPIEGKCDDQELGDFFTTVMATRVKEVESAIVVGKMGALSAATEEKAKQRFTRSKPRFTRSKPTLLAFGRVNLKKRVNLIWSKQD